ncbi:hypothetical protein CPLU01_05387 [Colletotrichum plurivorum]|uniref:Peptidase S8/S53 domain-containing protein n=1 Tax=Colletotrichum plurivorum TaxID=2175906 RepID=A0A8H6KMV3_9PEZI|nr:hypothetical protein CPLU01_05387 [Colletotrichum plurivorum]
MKHSSLTDEEDSDSEYHDDHDDQDEFDDVDDAETQSNEAIIQSFMDGMKKDPKNFEKQLANEPNKIFDTYHLSSESEINSKTVLHYIVEEFPKLIRVKGAVPHRRALLQAVKTITARYPHLLTITADGITPLYSAIQCCASINDDRLAGYMIRNCKRLKDAEVAKPVATGGGGDDDAASSTDDASHPLTEALAVECTSVSNNRSETVLHLAMRNHAVFVSNMKLLRRLASRASEAAVISRDRGKFTPLHYAVDYEWSSQEQYEIVELLLAAGESSTLIAEEKAVLDLHSKKDDMSVYEYHQWTRDKYKEPPTQPPKEVPNTKEAPGRGRNPVPTIHIPTRDGSERPNGRGDSQTLNSPMGYGLQRAPTEGHRVTERERQATTKEKEKDKAQEQTPEKRKEIRDQWFDKIQMLLKMKCLRTRSHEASTRFLYGGNPKDIQTWFDYQGVAAELDSDVFEDSFKNVIFDTVLRYVAFPPKVKRILKVIVDDSSQEPHSDAAIEKALEGFGVESLEWSKLDLDPETLYNATLTKTSPKLPPSSELSEVVLRWSGNNSALRAWGEPEGLRRLPKLKKTHALESMDRIKANIAKFEERLKEGCPEYVQKYLESKQQSKPAVPMGPPPPPRQGELSEEPVQLVPVVKLIWVKNAYGLRQANPSLSASAPSGDRNIISTAPHRWLEATDTFADHIENIWKDIVREPKKRPPRKTAGGENASGTPSANTSAPLKSQHGSEEIIVALIDDGVDTMEDQLADRVLPRRTFCFQDGRNMPWYASETGHGTVMASMIARVCPMAKIYPIRLNTGAKLTAGAGAMINPEYAAKAIRAAVDRGAAIISISWSVTRPANDLRDLLDKALQYALDNNVLLFCSSRDTGHTDSDITHYPAEYHRDEVIKIGAAQPTGLPYEWVGSLANVDFIMPGVEVVQRHGFRSPGGVQKLAPESGSSVATALAAGLGALIMHCARINQMFGSGARLGDKKILELLRAENMVKAIKNFGMSTSDQTKNKFVEVWHKLDDKSQQISRASLKEKREIVAELARDLIPP